MSLRLVGIVLFLSFLSIVSTEYSQKTSPPPFTVIQMPSLLNVTEGSDVMLNCRVEGNVSDQRWYIEWKKDGRKEEKIKNSTRVFVTTNKENKSSILILKAVDVTDSGIYQCCTGDSEGHKIKSTEVKIWEMSNVLVNQTPGHVNETEGANVTIKCHFRRVANLSLMEVKWHKDDQELSSSNHSVQLSQEGTLRLMNANVGDSGNYICTVRIRNRVGSGNGTHVHIHAGREKPSQNASINADNRQPSKPHENIKTGIGIPVGVGVAVGTFIFLLLLGVMLWRSKRKGKGISGNPSEVDPALTKEATKHTPLTNQVSNVTYADLRFHKRENQPDAEVVYAEVRGAKRPGHQDRATQPAGLC